MEEFYASHFEETASGTLTICKVRPVQPES